jgi:hypothetical protein
MAVTLTHEILANVAERLPDCEKGETFDLQDATMKRCLIILIALGACAADWNGDVCKLPTTPLVTPRSAPRTRNIILVTIDGVRWQEIFGGAARELPCRGASALVPNLQALGEAGITVGAVGEPMLSSGPKFVSLPGYREIVRGRASADCTDNECARLETPTLLDEMSDVAVIASWERIARVTPKNAVVSAGRHEGSRRDQLRVNARASQILDEGAHSRARPGYADYRPDRYTAALAKEYLRERRPRFLWVALGDTDEYAHRNDYDGYLASLRGADRLVGELWAQLGEMGEYGAETTLLVTADHGRADDFRDHGDAPESSRVWLVAAGGAVMPRGKVPAQRTVHLADIAPTVRVLLGLPGQGGEPIEDVLPPLWMAAKPSQTRHPDVTADRL